MSQGSQNDVLRAYELALRMGVRFIKLDVYDGQFMEDRVIPLVCTQRVRLDQMLHTIKEHAFKASDYPLIISLDIHCNAENQKALSNLLRNILEERLVTFKVSMKETDMPSPEALRHKIVLKTEIDEKAHASIRKEDLKQYYIGKVWFRVLVDGTGKELEDKQFREKELIWSETTISFVAPQDSLFVELSSKPYFVGFMKKECIEKFMLAQHDIQKGSFLISSNENHTKFDLSVYRGKTKPVIHIPDLVYDKGVFFFDTHLENDKFKTLDKLLEFYQTKPYLWIATRPNGQVKQVCEL